MPTCWWSRPSSSFESVVTGFFGPTRETKELPTIFPCLSKIKVGFIVMSRFANALSRMHTGDFCPKEKNTFTRQGISLPLNRLFMLALCPHKDRTISSIYFFFEWLRSCAFWCTMWDMEHVEWLRCYIIHIPYSILHKDR